LWTVWCSCSGFTGYDTVGSSICFPNVGTRLQAAMWFITKMDFHHLQEPQMFQMISYISRFVWRIFFPVNKMYFDTRSCDTFFCGMEW